MSTGERPFEVVFVCTGNQFRSPLAAAVFERETLGRPVRVSSCGIYAIEGSRAFAEAPDLIDELRVDLSQHRSRQLASLAHADLVIGFGRHHVDRAVADGCASPERTFTLPQAVALLEASPADGPPRERLAALQPENVAGPPPEVEDPIGLHTPRQREIMAEIDGLATRLARALFA